MPFLHYICCFGRKTAKVADQKTPKQLLLQFQNWVMDLRMGRRPCQLSLKEMEYFANLKAEMERLCGIVKVMYGVVKVQEYMREWDRIQTQYIQLLRENYRTNQLDVNKELLKTPSVRAMLGLSVRWA